MDKLKQRRATLADEGLKIITQAKSAGSPTPDQAKRLVDIEAELKGLDLQLKAAENFGDFESLFKGMPDSKKEAAARSLGDHFVKAAGNDLSQLRDRSNSTVSAPEFKANTDTVTTVGDALTPVLTDVDRTVVHGKRERPVVADLLGTGTISGNAISYFIEGAFEGDFETVAEGGQKPQVHVANPTAVTDPLRKIAAWITITDEFLEDLPFLKSEIDTRLLYKLAVFEEKQLLNGDGRGNNIKGLLNRDGVQVDTAASIAEAPDKVFSATTKISTATELTADGVLINPADYEPIRLAKDSNNQYYGGGFFQGAYGNGTVMEQPGLWGLRTIVTPAIDKGTILVGAFGLGGTVYRKGGVRVEATNTHADNFTSNKVTIRAEERLALAVRYPSAFVKLSVGAGS